MRIGILRIVSVNVGLPRPVLWRGRRIMSGIFKQPVAGPVRLRKLNLEGDGQADLSVHGGVHKAVYVYPSEHYAFWRRELALDDLPWGSFGENLTIAGGWEDEVHVGDRFRADTAEVVVTQPRLPCFKLAMRFDRDDVVERFLASGRPGFYLAVAQEGQLESADAMERIHEDENRVSVIDIVRLYLGQDGADPELASRAVRIEALPENWRGHIRKRLPPAP